MKRNFLFYIHTVAGLVSAIFILALSLSGSVLVFHDELDSLQRPEITATTGNILTVDSCYKIIQNKYPHAEISDATISAAASEPFLFVVYDPAYQAGKKPLQVFIHPQTGQVLHTRGGSDDRQHNFMSWLVSFHNSFRLHKKGEWLLGFFALCFTVSLLSGIIIYRKKILPALFFKKQVWRKGNLHQVIGVWALLFNLMIAITGFWMQRYIFKKDFYTVSTWERKLKTSPALFYNFDSAYANLQQQYPGFTASVIYFPQSKKSSTYIYGSRKSNSFIHSKKLADYISLDSTGKIAATGFVDSIPAANRYDIINAQVHFGQYGGLPVKIVYSLLGLTGGFLSLTGCLLWFKRRRKKNDLSNYFT